MAKKAVGIGAPGFPDDESLRRAREAMASAQRIYGENSWPTFLESLQSSLGPILASSENVKSMMSALPAAELSRSFGQLQAAIGPQLERSQSAWKDVIQDLAPSSSVVSLFAQVAAQTRPAVSSLIEALNLNIRLMGEDWKDLQVALPGPRVIDLIDFGTATESISVEVMPEDKEQLTDLARQLLFAVWVSCSVVALITAAQGWKYSSAFAAVSLAIAIWRELQKTFPDVFPPDSED